MLCMNECGIWNTKDAAEILHFGRAARAWAVAITSELPSRYHRIGASSQYLSSCASAAFHSLTKASLSCVTLSASGMRPPLKVGKNLISFQTMTVGQDLVLTTSLVAMPEREHMHKSSGLCGSLQEQASSSSSFDSMPDPRELVASLHPDTQNCRRVSRARSQQEYQFGGICRPERIITGQAT
jgi:hypothetical protein